MINGRPRRIHLKDASGGSAYEEGRAGATITPGMLIALNNAGTYVPHATADGPAEVNFALEDALIGKTIDDNYAIGDLVRFTQPRRGDVVLAILHHYSNVQDGDFLSSSGNGCVKKASGGDDSAILVALEDRNASDTDSTLEDRRIRARVL